MNKILPEHLHHQTGCRCPQILHIIYLLVSIHSVVFLYKIKIIHLGNIQCTRVTLYLSGFNYSNGITIMQIIHYTMSAPANLI